MKIETRIRKALAEPDPKVRRLKLYRCAFMVVPGSPIQNEIKAEIDKIESGEVKAWAKN